VKPPPPRARQQLIRHLADEHVLERELLIAFDHGFGLKLDQIVLLERREDVAERRAADHSVELAPPEHPSGHGSREKHGPLGRRQRVKSRGHDAAHGRR
jgi:hypothetical protein